MIQFDRVSKRYDKELFLFAPPALREASFPLAKGPKTIIGLVGANGAGKSTCIKLLMDFIRPTQGAIELFKTWGRCLLSFYRPPSADSLFSFDFFCRPCNLSA